jgi:hypothetical protein
MKIETVCSDPKLPGPSLILETPDRTYELMSDSIEDVRKFRIIKSHH